MANVADVGRAVERQPQTTSLKELVEQSAKELGRALPEHMRPERLVRIALTCLRTTPQLAECTKESFLGALFTAAQLGLEPIQGKAYLIPFNNKRNVGGQWMTVKEAQFVIGYKGVAELYYRHEKAIQLSWGIVKEKDDFSYELGTDEYLKHKPAKGERGKTIGYWVCAKLANGGRPFLYMTSEECLEHGKKHSKAYITKEWSKKEKKMMPCEPHFVDNSPWVTNLDSMCLKTVFVQLSKLLPLSSEIQKAIVADETSREYREGVTDILEEKDNVVWEAEEAEVKEEPKDEQKEEKKEEPEQEKEFDIPFGEEPKKK